MATTMASGAIFWSMIPSRSLPLSVGKALHPHARRSHAHPYPSKRAFISAHRERLVRPKRRAGHKAEDLMNRTAHNRRQVPGRVGHIRWRAPIFEPNNEGSLDLFDGAMALADVN